MFWLFLIRILIDNLCRKFSLVSVKLTIAILFYLWQKSYCFLGNKQQATGNRQQARGKSFNFVIYFLICHNLFVIAIDLTDEYQGVLVERLKMEGVKLDLADGFISQKPGCVKAI